MKEIALITRETRPAELREIATAEVLALQRSQLSPEEWTQLQALRARSERQTVPIQTGSDVLNWLLFVASIIGVAVAVGIVESVMARLRLTAIPKLLIGACVMSAFGLILVVSLP